MTSLPTTTTTQAPLAPRPDGVSPRLPVGPSTDSFNLRHWVNVLLRHLWLAIAVFVTVAVIMGVTFGLLYLYNKQYSAEGRMQLQDQASPMDRESPAMPEWLIESRQREECARLTDESTLSEMLARREADKMRWVVANPTKPMSLLAERLRATPVKNTRQVSVTMIDPDPETAAQFVNDLMNFYQERARSLALSDTERDRRTLEREQERHLLAISQIDSALNSMRASREFESLDRNRSEATDRVAMLSNMETQWVLANQQAAGRLAGLKQQYPDADTPPPPDLIARADEESPQVRELLRQRQGISQNLAILRLRFLPNHQAVKDMERQADEVEVALRDKRLAWCRQEISRLTTEADGAAKQAAANLEAIHTHLEAARERKRQLEQTSAEYSRLTNERTSRTQALERVRARLSDINVKVDSQSMPLKVAILATAPRPEDIYSPKWQYFLLGAIFLGLLLAVGSAVLLEFLDASIRTARDVHEHARMAMLGVLPLAEGVTGAQAYRIAVQEPVSVMAESFRRIRTNLLFSAPVDQLATIAVTSAAQDEGKTFVASNLAATVALSGRRVLLIDANFHRPQLNRIYPLTRDVGLSNLLTNQVTVQDAVQSADVPNLSIIATGPQPPNPAELLGSASMRRLLEQTGDMFDLVIVDGPPALLVSDALVLSTMVDGVIVVVRAAESSRGMVVRLREQLNRVRAKIIGSVLNAARATRGGYFRRSQQEYEQYHAGLAAVSSTAVTISQSVTPAPSENAADMLSQSLEELSSGEPGDLSNGSDKPAQPDQK